MTTEGSVLHAASRTLGRGNLKYILYIYTYLDVRFFSRVKDVLVCYVGGVTAVMNAGVASPSGLSMGRDGKAACQG